MKHAIMQILFTSLVSLSECKNLRVDINPIVGSIANVGSIENVGVARVMAQAGVICDPGTYGIATNSGSSWVYECSPCPINTYQPYTTSGFLGVDQCFPCQAGSVSSEGSSTCQACDTNNSIYRNHPIIACFPICGPGNYGGSRYENSMFITECAPCPENTYNNNPNANYLVQCKAN